MPMIAKRRCGQAGLIVAFLAALIVVHPIVALAYSDADELEHVGYLGYWSTDCSKPPSPSNWYVSIERRSDGSAVMASYTGAAKPYKTRKIEFVRRLAQGRIEIHLIDDYQPGAVEVFDLTIVVEPTRMRTMQSISSQDGEYSRDGKLKAGDQPTPWLYKCRARDSS